MCRSQLRSHHLVTCPKDFSQVISSVSVIAWSWTVLTMDAAIALSSLSNQFFLFLFFSKWSRRSYKIPNPMTALKAAFCFHSMFVFHNRLVGKRARTRSTREHTAGQIQSAQIVYWHGRCRPGLQPWRKPAYCCTRGSQQPASMFLSQNPAIGLHWTMLIMTVAISTTNWVAIMLHRIFGRMPLCAPGGSRPRRRKANDMRPNPGDMMAKISHMNIHLMVFVT